MVKRYEFWNGFGKVTPNDDELSEAGEFVSYDDYAVLLAENERLKAGAEKLERFRPLARWVSNCAGHGINSNQRRLGEELLVLIDAHKGEGDGRD